MANRKQVAEGSIFSLMRIPLLIQAPFNARMKTIDEIRRERLALLKAEYGGVGKLAEQLEKSFSQVSQWINASTHSATGKTRGISDEQCRMIEEKCEKPRGWMDSDPDMIDVKVLMQVIAGFLQATESGQRQIIESVKAAEKVVR